MQTPEQQAIGALARRIADSLIAAHAVAGGLETTAVRRCEIGELIEPFLQLNALAPAAQLAAAYDEGYQHGLAAFAWWRDGSQVVGTMPALLRDALATRTTLWNYRPPTPAGDPKGA